MRVTFDKQLEQLNMELIKMGALCEEAIAFAMKALLDNSAEMAEKAIMTDEQIDQMERDIESLCLKLLLQQQPVARDLRTISAALKMISDMERIGDQAADIAEMTEFVKAENDEAVKNLRAMSEAVIKMVTDSIDSFVKKDQKIARRVLEEDDLVDDLFLRVKKDIIRIIAEGGENGEYYTDLLMIAKYLERIGDHATNISEWVIFSITGKHVN